MASFATAADIEALWRPLTDSETAIVEALLDHASTLLRSRAPRLDARITAGELDESLAKLAVVQMVQRVLLNPDGLQSENTGPFSVRFDPDRATGLLAVTDADLALVVPQSGKRRVRNMSLRAGLR